MNLCESNIYFSFYLILSKVVFVCVVWVCFCHLRRRSLTQNQLEMHSVALTCPALKLRSYQPTLPTDVSLGTLRNDDDDRNGQPDRDVITVIVVVVDKPYASLSYIFWLIVVDLSVIRTTVVGTTTVIDLRHRFQWRQMQCNVVDEERQVDRVPL